MKNNLFIYDETGGMILDYKIVAKQLLSQYKSINCAVDNLKMRLYELRSMLTAISNPSIKERVQGGKAEDKRLSMLCEIDRLECICKLRQSDIKRMDKALAVLNDEQRKILWEFYIDGQSGHIERLMSELCMERRTVYYRHDEALKCFTIAMFGACDM